MLKEIPIVMASDENYYIPMAVAIASLCYNAEEDTKYQFILLLDEGFSDEKKERLNKITDIYEMPPINYICMKEKFGNTKSKIEHITKPTFYRLEIPSLLNTIDKCIYLDVDMVVNGDLSEIFDINMDNYYIAGVKAAGYYYPESNQEKMKSILNIAEFNQYVNAGMLVMNLGLMRANNLEQRFFELLGYNFPNNDQDILNSACYGKIKILHPKYNAMTKYSLCDEYAYEKIPCLPICYSKDEWESASSNPIVIHYADKWKPWENMSVDFAEVWWYYARKISIESEAFEYFFDNMFKKQKSQKKTYETQIKDLIELRDTYRHENLDLKKHIKEVWNETDLRIAKLREDKDSLANALMQAREEKEKIRNELMRAYEEKSEINKKLQITYDEKAERGLQIKTLKGEIKQLNDEIVLLKNEKSFLKKKINIMEKNIGIRIAKKLNLINYDFTNVEEKRVLEKRDE